MLWHNLISSASGKLVIPTYSNYSITPGSSFSFAGVGIGEVHADRVLIVAVMASGATARTISGVTIAGNAATLVTKNTSFKKCTGIYMLAVPTGSTATVAVSLSGSMAELGVSVFILSNWGTVTAYDSGTNTATSTSINVSGFDIPANGFALTVYCGSAESTSGGGMPGQSGSTGSLIFATATARGQTTHVWPTVADTNVSNNRSTAGASDKSQSAASFS